MTDNEIIKALEYCKDCSAKLNVEIIDLINRQQKDIDDLCKVLGRAYQENCFLEASRKCVKAEAIKEFAEKLKDDMVPNIDDTYIESFVEEYIDNLVKEMVGEER